MACGVSVGNPYSRRDIYEESLREIAANFNYVASIGGFQESGFAGDPINEWTAVTTPASQAVVGLWLDRNNVVYAGQGTQTGDYTTQTAFSVRLFTVGGTALSTVSIPYGSGAGQTRGVTDFTVDGDGAFHLYNAVDGRIDKFTAAGVYATSYTPSVSDFIGGSCIAYNYTNDRVYAATNFGRLYAFDTDGVELFARNAGADLGGIIVRSVGFAVSGNTVWLDYFSGLIFIYDADLSGLVFSFDANTTSSGNGSLASNSRLSVDFANQVYFTTNQQKVVRCNLNGVFQDVFGGSGAGALGTFTLAGHVWVSTTGQVFVSDVTEDTITRFFQAIVFIDVEVCPLRKYAATNECSVGEFSRIVPHGFNADGTLVATPGAMNVPIPPTILGSGRYQAPLHVLVLRDLRQCCDELGRAQKLVHPGTLRQISRDWATEDDLYYSAVGHDSELLEAVEGDKQYQWQRTLGRIAALRPNPADFVELLLVTRYLRQAAQAMVGDV